LRMLHTADWHLGKMFYGDYLTSEQSYVLREQFLPMVRDEKIDVVLLAGDVYDRSLPPAEAVELCDEIVTKLTMELKIPLLLISGNHDSAARLSFGSRLLARQQVYIAAELDKLSGPVYLDDDAGTVAFVPVPFAEPAQVRHFFDDAAVTDHQSALERVLQQQRAGIPAGMRTVCVAHAFVAGGTASDSERPLSIGGTDLVDASIFQDFAYTALGHLHGPQQAGSAYVRYAGSLLKYSFGEARQKKGAVIVDLPGDGQADVSWREWSPRHDVRIIDGMFEDIMKGDDGHSDDFVLVRLEDTGPILDAMARLRHKYPNVMALETPGRQASTVRQDRDFDFRKITERQLFERFAADMRKDKPLTEEERTCLDGLWQRLWQERGEQDS
jgi:exonuclease SbcD